jgi:hypothetical protein
MRVPPSRRNTSKPRAPSGAAAEVSKLGDLTPLSVDYDEARSSEERATYHQPRLMAQGEFFLDVHPVARVKSLLGRRKRSA